MKPLQMGMLALVLSTVGLMPQLASAEAPFVKLETATSSAEGLSRVFFGHVVARETVDLAFQVSGQVITFPLEEGAVVPAGGLVARLDQEPFLLSLEDARARAQQAERTLDRYRQLQGSSVSQTTVQDAQTDVELTGVALRNAERALEQATLHAPFDALVAARLVPKFSTINAGTPVVRLHDMSELRIEIDVPETLFQQAGQNPDLEITAEFPASPKPYPVELREFNAETAAVGQTYSITLGMAPPDDLTVLPGSSAKVTARLKTGDSRIIVPASALVTGNDGATFLMVFTLTGASEGTVTRTPVTIAATEHGTVEVTSGLAPGAEYVAVGAPLLKDGDKVRRFTGFGK